MLEKPIFRRASMNKKIFLLAILIISSACANPEKKFEPTPLPDDTPVEYYAVLAEKDSYADVDMAPLMVNYIDIKRMREALEDLGWPMENIHEVKEFDQASLKVELDWLEENADTNDLVFFYITGHGAYLHRNIRWESFFPREWAQIASHRRVLLVDTCTAAEFTNALKTDPNPYLALAAVDDDEYGWKGIEKEGLPIIGGIFTFYFAEALVELKADVDGDGKVSVQEAARIAEEKQRTYMQEIVFGVPAFLEMYHTLGENPEKDKTFPDVIVDDTIGLPIILDIN
jgi:hypothetical protein